VSNERRNPQKFPLNKGGIKGGCCPLIRGNYPFEMRKNPALKSKRGLEINENSSYFK
jgi:hypothetical protein